MDIKAQLIALTAHFVIDSSSHSIMAYNGNGEYFDLPEKNELALTKLLSFHGIELPIKAIKRSGKCSCLSLPDQPCDIHGAGTINGKLLRKCECNICAAGGDCSVKQECCSDGMCHRCNP